MIPSLVYTSLDFGLFRVVRPYMHYRHGNIIEVRRGTLKSDVHALKDNKESLKGNRESLKSGEVVIKGGKEAVKDDEEAIKGDGKVVNDNR